MLPKPETRQPYEAFMEFHKHTFSFQIVSVAVKLILYLNKQPPVCGVFQISCS